MSKFIGWIVTDWSGT